MKWWVAGTAGAALILAGASVWLGSSVDGLVTEAQKLWFVSLGLAYLAYLITLLSVRNAQLRRRRNWARALYGLVSLQCVFGMMGALNVVPKGPFCSRFLSDGVSICAQNAPLATDVFLFTPVFIFSLVPLVYVFWPHEETPQPARIEHPSADLR
jgi:hypothetical protein